jgi:hypothetical protein
MACSSSTMLRAPMAAARARGAERAGRGQAHGGAAAGSCGVPGGAAGAGAVGGAAWARLRWHGRSVRHGSWRGAACARAHSPGTTACSWPAVRCRPHLLRRRLAGRGAVAATGHGRSGCSAALRALPDRGIQRSSAQVSSRGGHHLDAVPVGRLDRISVPSPKAMRALASASRAVGAVNFGCS